MTDARRDEDGDVFARQPFEQAALVDDAIHHLCDAEAVPEVVKRIVPVVLLDAQLQEGRRRHVGRCWLQATTDTYARVQAVNAFM